MSQDVGVALLANINSIRRLNVATSEPNDNSARTFVVPRRIYRYRSPRSIKSTTWPIAADSSWTRRRILSRMDRAFPHALDPHMLYAGCVRAEPIHGLVFRGDFLAVVLIARSKYRRASRGIDGLDSIGRERPRSIARRVMRYVDMLRRSQINCFSKNMSEERYVALYRAEYAKAKHIEHFTLASDVILIEVLYTRSIILEVFIPFV